MPARRQMRDEKLMYLAFTAAQVASMTGVSVGRLRSWERTGIFHSQWPEGEDFAGGPFARLYSFRDLVSLYTLKVLRDRYSIPPRVLREVSPWLHTYSETPWATLQFYRVGSDIFFLEPGKGAMLGVQPPKQAFLPFKIDMERVSSHINRKLSRMRQRKKREIGKTTRNRYVLHNETTIAGTRIATRAVWEFSQAGYSIEQIIGEYPRLTPRDVQAAIQYEQDHRAKKAS